MKENEQEFIAESSSTRVAISALVSTIREMFFSHMYDAKHRDKQIINISKKSFDKLYYEFDRLNIADNIFYDNLVEKFQNHAEDMSMENRRDIFCTFVSVIDFACIKHADKVIYTDKYIIYHISLIIRNLARQFCNKPSDDVKKETVELLNHFEERREEIKKILIENYAVSKVSE